MQYANITRNDKNPIKRFLQRKRLDDALDLTASFGNLSRVLDYGAGDAELSRLLASRDPAVKICCYEPCESLRNQAVANTQGMPNIEIIATPDHLPAETFDLVFCMEVFEHLPPDETEDALGRIYNLLRAGGTAVIGVPIEMYLPALFKGLFRISRRYGDYDGKPWNVLRASLGSPPRDRPTSEIKPGMRYHYHHMGFDHRRLEARLRPHFSIVRRVGSPFAPLGTFLNSEVYYVVEKPRERGL